MKTSMRSNAALRRGLRALLARLVQEARRHLECIPREPEQPVHDLRLCMKTFSAVLRLLEKHVPRATRRSLLASAKRLRTAFSAQRDAQVAAKLAEEFEMPAIYPVMTSATMTRVPLFVEVARLEKALEKLDLTAVDRDDVMRAYLKSYRNGGHQLKVCRRLPSPDNLHRWRKRVKRFYFQSVVLGLDGNGMNQRIQRARRLGHLLGRDHDLHLLAMRAAGARETGVMRRITAARKSLQGRIMKLGRRLYDLPARKLKHQLEARD